MKTTKSSPSEKQIAANRQNALKSTGPRTAQGREASKLNACKHGILSREVLVRGVNFQESEADLEALHQRFWEDLTPAGALEEMLVDQIVTAHWRLRRALTAEAGAITQSVDRALAASERMGYKQPEVDAGQAAARLPDHQALDKILRYETTLEKQIFRTVAQLERIQRMRGGERDPRRSPGKSPTRGEPAREPILPNEPIFHERRADIPVGHPPTGAGSAPAAGPAAGETAGEERPRPAHPSPRSSATPPEGALRSSELRNVKHSAPRDEAGAADLPGAGAARTRAAEPAGRGNPGAASRGGPQPEGSAR